MPHPQTPPGPPANPRGDPYPRNPNRDTPRIEFRLSHRKQRPALISNRDTTASSRRALHRPPVTDHRSGVSLLIGHPVIRIRRKPPRINHLKISNRHKPSILWTATARRRLSISAPHTHTAGQHASEPPTKLLIGPPVIRICPKSFRIRLNFSSNRHKTHPSLSVFDAGSHLLGRHAGGQTREWQT